MSWSKCIYKDLTAWHCCSYGAVDVWWKIQTVCRSRCTDPESNDWSVILFRVSFCCKFQRLKFSHSEPDVRKSDSVLLNEFSGCRAVLLVIAPWQLTTQRLTDWDLDIQLQIKLKHAYGTDLTIKYQQYPSSEYTKHSKSHVKVKHKHMVYIPYVPRA